MVGLTLSQQSCNASHALLTVDFFKNPSWIIELEAIDHMTYNSYVLRNPTLSHKSSVANGKWCIISCY